MKRLLNKLLPKKLWKLLALQTAMASLVMIYCYLSPLISECRYQPSFLKYFIHAKYVTEYNGGDCKYGFNSRPYPVEALIISDHRRFQLGEEICPACAMSHGEADIIANTELRPILDRWIKLKEFLNIDFGDLNK